jgi:hypothetical protein
MEEFLTRDVPSGMLSESLNQFGREGWLIVNCWPAKKGVVTCVFRRPRVYLSKGTDAYKPARPLRELTAEVALERCLDQPVFRHRGAGASTFERSITLDVLGTEFGSSQMETAERLREVGFVKSTTTGDCFATVVGRYNLWIHRKGPKKLWILYAKKLEEVSTEPNEADLTAPRKFSVPQAIKLCLEKPPKTGMDYSLNLAEAAKAQGTDLPDAMAAFREIGLPTRDHKDPEKRYITSEGRQIALRAWEKVPGTWFLNIRRV